MRGLSFSPLFLLFSSIFFSSIFFYSSSNSFSKRKKDGKKEGKGVDEERGRERKNNSSSGERKKGEKYSENSENVLTKKEKNGKILRPDILYFTFLVLLILHKARMVCFPMRAFCFFLKMEILTALHGLLRRHHELKNCESKFSPILITANTHSLEIVDV